jgi:acyl-CoA reductase-like NAD-dependent aldehyde dehydrogenase
MAKKTPAEVAADALAAQARAEARSGGTDAPATAEMKQKMADRKAEKAAESAPTTKTEMGKPFKSGGVTRADGCISKGHTRGKMV